MGERPIAARRVKRDTLGLEPREITALHRHHEASDALDDPGYGTVVAAGRAGYVTSA